MTTSFVASSDPADKRTLINCVEDTSSFYYFAKSWNNSGHQILKNDDKSLID